MPRRSFNTLLAAGAVPSMAPQLNQAQALPKAGNIVLIMVGACSRNSEIAFPAWRT